jgi:hypothetical protein
MASSATQRIGRSATNKDLRPQTEVPILFRKRVLKIVLVWRMQFGLLVPPRRLLGVCNASGGEKMKSNL